MTKTHIMKNRIDKDKNVEPFLILKDMGNESKYYNLNDVDEILEPKEPSITIGVRRVVNGQPYGDFVYIPRKLVSKLIQDLQKFND